MAETNYSDELVVPLGKDAGGTMHQVKTDSQGRLYANIISGEIVASIGTVEVVKSGTIDTIKSSTVGGRKSEKGTIAHNVQINTADKFNGGIEQFSPGTITVDGRQRLTVGMKEISEKGTVDMYHEFRLAKGGQWYTDGVDNCPPGTQMVVNLNFNAYQYRPRFDNSGTINAATVQVEYNMRY